MTDQHDTEALRAAATAYQGQTRYPGCFGHGSVDEDPVIADDGAVCCPMCAEERAEN